MVTRERERGLERERERLAKQESKLEGEISSHCIKSLGNKEWQRKRRACELRPEFIILFAVHINNIWYE